jgi:hypothetical protein
MDWLCLTLFFCLLYAFWRLGKRLGRLNPVLGRGPRLVILVVTESALFIIFSYFIAWCREVGAKIVDKDLSLGRELGVRERIFHFLGEASLPLIGFSFIVLAIAVYAVVEVLLPAVPTVPVEPAQGLVPGQNDAKSETDKGETGDDDRPSPNR